MKNHKEILQRNVLKLGWKSVSNMIGFENLYKIGFNNDPMEFLNLFNNLDIVQSEEDVYLTLYRFEKGNNMMIYDKKNDYVHIKLDVIWSFFFNGIGLKYSEIKEIMKKWLDEVYNLKGVTPQTLAHISSAEYI